ncbi:MAG: hypothetical protein RBT36_05225 [Desulfobulbus sp.]|jgi:hypothetical protein|nr:hypothetical protein [Desulfobulbus sp.]
MASKKNLRSLRRLLKTPARKVSSTGALRRLLKEQRRMRLRSIPVHPDTFIITPENTKKEDFQHE